MKSKRRHELQTNELADRIGQFIERIRPYSTAIVAAAAGIAVVVVAWYFLSSGRARKQAVAWQAYFSAASDPQSDMTGQLSEVADNFPGTVAGLWASQTAADLSLEQGVRLLFTDRALAETSLNIARARYREVVESSLAQSHPMLLERARFGLAQTAEALGDLEEASKYYQLVAAEDPDSSLGRLARQRQETVNDPDVIKWYNWFGRQKPAPPPKKTPGGPSSMPDLGSPTTDLPDLPDLPDEDFLKETPRQPAAEKPASDVPAGAKPTTEPAPAAANAPAADDAPGKPEGSASTPAKSDSQPSGPTSKPSAPK